MKFLQLLVLAAVATIVVPQTASVWLSSSAISAKTMTLITASVPLFSSNSSQTLYSYPTLFNSIFTNVPSVALGMVGLDLSYSTNLTSIDNSVSNLNTSGYTHLMQVVYPTYISKLTVSYFAVDTGVLTFFSVGTYARNPQLLNNGATNTQTHSQAINFTISEPAYLNGVAGNTYSTNLFLAGFSVLNSTTTLSLSLASTLSTTAPTLTLTLGTNGGNFTNFRMFFIVVHTNSTITEGVYFLESGTIAGATDLQTTFPVFASWSANNFIIGVTSFAMKAGATFDFVYSMNSSYSLSSTSGYTSILLSYTHFRVKGCNTSANPWLRVFNDTCVSNCPNSTNYFIKQSIYQVCLECSPYCLTCSASNQSECVTCSAKDNRIFNSTTKTCQCNTGYVDVNNQTLCGRCHYTCLTCSAATSASACLTCDATTRLLTGTTCPCKTGMVQVGQAICAASSCPAGQYSKSDATCAACAYYCATCNITSTNCLTCPAGRTLNATDGRCNCNAGTGDDGTTATCVACNSKCATCTWIATFCTSCTDTTTRTVVNGECGCKIGYYETGAAACTACDVKCLTCEVASTNCTSCAPTRVLTANACPCASGFTELNTAQCGCGPLYFNAANVTCTATCNYTCATCATNTTNCLTCPVTRTLASGACICNNGLYDSGVTTCAACSYTCTTCNNTATSCLSCPATRALVQSNCLCTTGLFDIGVSTCAACHYTCENCNGTLTACTSCVPTRLLFANTSTCPCRVGYFDAGVGACSACNVTCLTCLGTANNCTSCNTTRTLTSTNTCLASTSFLENPTSNWAVACNYQCLNCVTDVNTCSACPTTRALNGTLCPCVTGYYDAGVKVCSACNNRCLTCVGTATNCTTCPSTRTLVGSDCVCSPGFWENGTQICAPDSAQSQNSLSLAHGIVQSICWCLLADLAIFVRYIYTFKYRVAAHVCLMLATVIGSIAVMAAMINLRAPKIEAITTSDRRAHVVIGYIALAWVILQFILGVVSRVIIGNPYSNPRNVLISRRIHRYSGYLLIILCKVNVLIGWGMNSVWTAFGVMIADILIIAILAIVYRVKFGKKIALTDKASLDVKDYTDMYDPAMEEIVDRPYNEPFVQFKNVVVFDDKIYELPSEDFHPGGRQFTKHVNGREIDRFLYGMSNLEMHPELPAIEHPKTALGILGSPVGLIPPNPVVELPRENFHATSQRIITNNLSLFYFECDSDHVNIKDIVNLRHLGQYFAISAFGKTRLYSVVLSQTKSNRNLCDHIVTSLIPAERQLKNQWDEAWNRGLREEPSSAALGVDMKISAKTTDGHELPLLIKRYDNDGAMTKLLFATPQTPLTIEGPKGRGLCLSNVKPGSIAIIAGGTGLFPFLDLIDMIFKATCKHSSIPVNELKLAEQTLAKHSFNFLITVNNVQDLVVPDQLQVISQAKNPRAQIHLRVKEGLPEWAFPNSRQEERFGVDTINNYIWPITDLQMVYVCGPASLYKDMVTQLREIGLQSDKIFFV